MQLAASSGFIDPDKRTTLEKNRRNDNQQTGEATWKVFSSLVAKEIEDREIASTSEFIYKCSPNSH